MGNCMYINYLPQGEHCHRIYKNGTKSIIICKNDECKRHICCFYNCKKNMYLSYLKYGVDGEKIHVEICNKYCLCHQSKCIVLNKCDDKINRKISNNIYADPNPLICHRCNSNDDNHHNFDFDFNFDD